MVCQAGGISGNGLGNGYMSEILGALLNTSLGGEITRVLIGLHWTAVVTKVDGQERCGLASTLRAQPGHHVQADIPRAGKLASLSAAEVTALARSDHLPQAAVGVAALNALLPPIPKPWQNVNAEDQALGLAQTAVYHAG